MEPSKEKKPKLEIKVLPKMEIASTTTTTPSLVLSTPIPPVSMSSSSSTSSPSSYPEPQPGPSGVNTRKFAQTPTHQLKRPIISVIDDIDSDSDVEYHSSYQRSPQPSTSKTVLPIRIKLHPRNPSKNTVLTAPDLQLNWDSSDSNSSDDVIILPNENSTLPIDLTNDSDEEMDVKPVYKRKFSNVSNASSGPAQSSASVNIESVNPRDAIPPSNLE